MCSYHQNTLQLNNSQSQQCQYEIRDSMKGPTNLWDVYVSGINQTVLGREKYEMVIDLMMLYVSSEINVNNWTVCGRLRVTLRHELQHAYRWHGRRNWLHEETPPLLCSPIQTTPPPCCFGCLVAGLMPQIEKIALANWAIPSTMI